MHCIGADPKQADAISDEQEQTLWDKGIFSMDTATGLSYAGYFYMCKAYGLRGRDEHRSLSVDQFVIGNDENGRYLKFVGHRAKNNQGGLKQRKVKNKILKQYDDAENPISIYKILTAILGHVPKEGPFYLQPLAPQP